MKKLIEKKRTAYLSRILCTCVLFISMSHLQAQNNPLFDYIPGKPSTVIHMDLLRLQAKLPHAVFEQSIIYKELTKNPDSPLPQFLKNPLTTGIDFTAGVMITTNNSRLELIGFGNAAHIFFKLNNPALFKSFVEKMIARKSDVQMGEETQEIKIYGTDHILYSDGKMSMAWNEKIMVLSSGSEEYDYFEGIPTEPDTLTVYTDSAVVTYDTTVLSPVEEAKTKALAERKKRNQLFELLTQKFTNPLTEDQHFAGLMKEKADIRVWSNKSDQKIPGGFFGGAAQILTRIQQLGTKKSTAIINFENGRISMLAKNYPSPKVADLYKDFKISHQNGELLRKLPPENVIGLMSITLDKLMVNRIIDMMDLQSMIEKMNHEEIPVKIDLPTLTAAFKPNMLMALLKTDEVGEEAEAKKMDGISFLMAIPIADKSKVDQLRTTLQPYLDSMKISNPEKMKKSPVIKFNDDMLVMALSSKTADAFLFNPAPGESPAWLHEFSQYPIVMNFNFKKLFSFLIKKESEHGKEEMEAVLKTFDQVFFYGGNFNKDAVEMNMEFRFVKKEENALKQFFEMLGVLK